MAAPEYWSSAEAVEHLGMKLNAFRQVVHRDKVHHEEFKHSNNGKCPCILYSHEGNGLSYYRKDKIQAYGLQRRGFPGIRGEIMKAERKMRAVQPVGKASKGRPTTRIGKSK